jgi:hypothetical protein
MPHGIVRDAAWLLAKYGTGCTTRPKSASKCLHFLSSKPNVTNLATLSFHVAPAGRALPYLLQQFRCRTPVEIP